MPFVIKKFGGKYFVINEKSGKRKNKTGYDTRKEAEAFKRVLDSKIKDE
jgi:hypothetical protein